MRIGPDAPLTIAGLARVAARPEPVHLTVLARERIAAAAAFLDRIVADRRVVYGITTGFGPLAGTWIDPARAEDLQTYLLAHLRAGVGPPLPRPAVRGMMLARLASLAQGHSGIGPGPLELLAAMLERDVTPVVPEMGTVGASGDLTPLAHMAATLQGEGEVLVGDRRLPADEGLAAAGLEPVRFGPKEAIALVNGTSTMTAIAALNGAAVERQVMLAVELGLLYAEIFGARAEAYDRRVGAVRPHPGQVRVHELIATWTAGGSRLEPTSSTTGRLPEDAPGGIAAGQRVVQDPYTIRCIPQLYGAVFDTVRFHNEGVERELNAVSDNPLLFPDDGEIIQAGNFFGQHVAAASDALTAGIITVAGHIERSIDRVTDPLRSAGLPPMLQAREPGLQSGLMGAQVSATALLAEMRTRATPAGIQSIPTNAGNQDVVTMGTIAARNAAWQVERLWDLLAIQGIAMAQAAELRGRAEFSPPAQALVRAIRRWVPPLEDDRALSGDISCLADALRRGAIDPDAVLSN